MQGKISPAALLASLPAASRQDLIQSLSPKEAEDTLYDWAFWARPNQMPPRKRWRVWLICAGRGFGKTRVGSEASKGFASHEGYQAKLFGEVVAKPGSRGALVGRTAADVRDVMIEGESGILACSSPDFRPIYEPSKRRLTWPNGTIATAYSADEPSLLRGPQHHWAWCDELAAWKRPEAWDQLLFGLRLGEDPRVIVTTTPRPTRIIRDLIKDPLTMVTRGSTKENAANLAIPFLAELVKKYEGTTLGRQELHAEILDEMPGALWTRATIGAAQTNRRVEYVRIITAIDPAVTAKEGSNETGIIVAALGSDGDYYVLDDRSMLASPDAWMRAAIDAHDEHKGDRVIAEVNQGGDLVETLLRTIRKDVPFDTVHASRGKRTRAEPVAALYEQGRVHHVRPLPDLEDQLVNWEPGIDADSPDRLDALVWAITYLSNGAPAGNLVFDSSALYQGAQWNP